MLSPLSSNDSNNEIKQFFPEIKNLVHSDSIFKQYSQEVVNNYILLAKDLTYNFSIYTYTVKDTDDLFSIAARCNIPYETIATLNRIPFIDSVIVGNQIYLSTVKGIFLPEKATEPIEFLLKTRYSNIVSEKFFIGETAFSFIPNDRFSGTERLFFTDSGMVPPMDEGIISSNFGMRESPFSGEQKFHKGVDIAAPLGTNVFATKGGIIAAVDYNHPVYGHYVVVQHDNNTQSLYAHLDTITVFTDEICSKRQIIGTVGTTGLSTGPHLHFEIRIGSRVEDPTLIINNFLQ